VLADHIWNIYFVFVVLFGVGTSCASIILMECLFCSFKKKKKDKKLNGLCIVLLVCFKRCAKAIVNLIYSIIQLNLNHLID